MKNAILRLLVATSILMPPGAAISQGSGSEQSWPSRTIRIVVPANAGGPTDIVARLVADKLSQSLGQPVIVENRPGASQMLGTNAVAKSDPDGYTLLVAGSTPIVVVPFTVKNVPYDVRRELITVSHMVTTPLVLYVNNTTPAKSLSELLDIARANPANANYGSYGNGSSAHILNEHLVKQTGVKMVHIPYKGVAPQLQDLVGRQILTGVADFGSAAALMDSGQIRAIAVTGSTRSSLKPDVPTFAEQGIAGMEPLSSWFGVFAPRKTPKPIVDRLSVEVQKIVKSPEIGAKLKSLGSEATGLLVDDAERATDDELRRWQKIVEGLPDVKFD